MLMCHRKQVLIIAYNLKSHAKRGNLQSKYPFTSLINGINNNGPKFEP